MNEKPSALTTSTFDRSFYDRYYRSPRTRVASQRDTYILGAFVCSYLKYLRIHVERVVDLGCGLGFWKKVIARHFPRASYLGVEYSSYLCETMGWKRGSVVRFRSRKPFDLVICQGVLQYLGDDQARQAIENLHRACRGAVYLEALTKRDLATVCDRDATDDNVHLRPGKWYRRLMREHFIAVGGGLFISRSAHVHLFELESNE